MTTENQLSKIFSHAGEILSHRIIEEGNSPNKSFKNEWVHKNGVVLYDGKDWTYNPNPVPKNIFLN